MRPANRGPGRPASDEGNETTKTLRPETSSGAAAVGRLHLLFGKIAIELGYLTGDELRQCIRLQQRTTATAPKPIGEVCRDQGLLNSETLQLILDEQRLRLASSKRLRRPRLGHSEGRTRRPLRREPRSPKAEQPTVTPGAEGDRRPVASDGEREHGTGPQLAIGGTPSGVWGPFEIKSVLGRGGMGAVYLAKNLMLRRLVAVKVPFEGGGSPEERRGFLREARSVACIDHPNVVRVHSVGEVDGLPYLEMEYAPGRSLDRQMTHKKLEPWKAIEVFVRVCRGVAAAHDKGVIHRDLKPENILCCDDSRVLVTDFGLARITRGTIGPEDSRFIMGTVGFIAPELIQGGTPDVRSDLYSLGALLYNILTGEMPFDGNLPMQVFMAQLARPAPALLSIDPELPPWLEGIVARLLARAPETRYASVHELLDKMNRR